MQLISLNCIMEQIGLQKSSFMKKKKTKNKNKTKKKINNNNNRLKPCTKPKGSH